MTETSDSYKLHFYPVVRDNEISRGGGEGRGALMRVIVLNARVVMI